MKLTILLKPSQAAALHRLCDKITHSDAMAYLYPHVSYETRSAQAHEIVSTCLAIQKALEAANVRHWPWIETGPEDPDNTGWSPNG